MLLALTLSKYFDGLKVNTREWSEFVLVVLGDQQDMKCKFVKDLDKRKWGKWWQMRMKTYILVDVLRIW